MIRTLEDWLKLRPLTRRELYAVLGEAAFLLGWEQTDAVDDDGLTLPLLQLAGELASTAILRSGMDREAQTQALKEVGTRSKKTRRALCSS